MKNIILIASIVVSITLSSHSLAWGKTGHRVVAAVAANHLTPKAKKKIKAILQGHSMVEVANWMDDIKSDPNPDLDTLRSYHWVTIPDGKTYATSNINPRGDVIAGIHIVVKKLKAGNLSPKLARQYLKMLIHFVGDLHQPLHCGRENDRGGNNIKVTWFGSYSNLHSVWDSDMINSKLYSYSELANIIDAPVQATQVKTWQAGTVEDWAQECVNLRSQIYDFDTTKSYWEYKYEYNNWNTVKLQLEKGGVRLAELLNEIFG